MQCCEVVGSRAALDATGSGFGFQMGTVYMSYVRVMDWHGSRASTGLIC